MKQLSIVLLMLLALAVVGVVTPGRDMVVRPAEPVTAAESDWVRTSNGWEDSTTWHRPLEEAAWCAAISRVHPGVVAALQVLVSLGGLLAFPARTNRYALNSGQSG